MIQNNKLCFWIIITLFTFIIIPNIESYATPQSIPKTKSSHSSVKTSPKHRGFIRRQLDQLSGTKESAHESGLLLFPTISYAPETRWDIGLNALYVYYANENVKNRLSEINTFGFYTQEHQYGVWIDHTLYSDHNFWFFYGKARFQYFPIQYYGIGTQSSSDIKAIIESEIFWIRERILRQIKGSFYLGLELDFQSIHNVKYDPQNSHSQHPVPFGIEGGTQLGLGLGVVYDNCHNAMNVRDGILAEVGFLHYSQNLNTYPMNQLFFDGRFFYPTTKNQVLATQFLGDFAFGKIPYNQLPSLGGAMMMRGYYVGRYRDRRSLASQIEYRWLPFTNNTRWGGAIFGSIASVFPQWEIKKAVWSAGFGPRFLLFPQKDIFTRFDIAFTAEGQGFYFYIGESF
jgi:hypothetical protein